MVNIVCFAPIKIVKVRKNCEEIFQQQEISITNDK